MMSMKVYEIMQRLSVDQLSNLAMSGEGSGAIRESDHLKIINGINSAMKRLYSKFVIQEKYLMVMLNTMQTAYPLKSEYSYSYYETNPQTPGVPYIYDVGGGLFGKFEDDILQIISVKDGHGRPVTFNDPLKANSVVFPSVDKLIVKANHLRGYEGEVRITYKPKYKPLDMNEDVLENDVAVPEVLHEALLALIASSVYAGMNGQENAAISQGYLNMYESLCTEVSFTDVINESVSSIGDKFNANGWT